MDKRNIKYSRHHFFLLLGMFCLTSVWSQPAISLSLTEAYKMARDQYPLLGNHPLLQKANELQLENIDRSKLPSVHWKADATLQSEVVAFPDGEMAPINIDLPLYNLKTYAEAQYQIYDGGSIETQKAVARQQLAADQQSLEVDAYQVHEQVNRYFFGVLLLREQVGLLNVTLKDLEEKKSNLEAGVRHGAVLPSEVDKMEVRQLEIMAEREQVQQDIRSYLSVLEELTGAAIDENANLTLPNLDTLRFDRPLNRPEQELFKRRKQALLANEQLIDVHYRPRLHAFLNAGFGYPNPLNFFDNSVAPYAIGGLSFNWNFVDWGKKDRDRQLLSMQAQIIDNQQLTFEHQMNLTKEKYRKDVVKLENRITRDQEIADLQSQILLQLSSQLENGVITVTDYLTQVNAELSARQQLELHRVQLQQVKIDYLTQRGAL
ncbi:MAG: TolC family protein [Bacteroidota bacterium]